MIAALRAHWPEYLIEGALLGFFMISACVFGVLLGHPASPLVRALPGPGLRRLLMGLAMGLTAIALIYSPWGRRSGAHFNPAVTLTFLRLGKIEPPDALFYVLAQFAGGIAGVLAARSLLGGLLADPEVGYVVTVPGPAGPGAAFAAEAGISFLLIAVILAASNDPRLTRLTGLLAGALVAIYIFLESPLSGMSMNPARTLGSAVPGDVYTDIWIYFTAPPLGMLLAAQAYLGLKGARGVHCAKLHHAGGRRCIFRCNFGALASESPRS
ncbi:MAG TPA: aquaporin [Candidatus Polarisedimenticolia bacterium]|nr:aquaporin [Candidatus Polarisedimenticolia bacterium]